MPRDTLTKDRIIQAAIELLDAEGLEGLNMRSLGDRLGSAATAVYWHVKSKDNLVLLCADEVWHEIELPDLDTVGWRTAGTTMAKDLYAMMIRHPWLVQALGTHLLHGPGKARHDDHNIGVYELAGFVGAEADQATATVFMFVLGSALGEAAAVSLNRRLQRDSGNAQEQIRESMEEQTKIAMQFPRLRARIETLSDADYTAAPEKSFEYGLEVVFDGLEGQLLHGQVGARRPEGRTTGWFA